MIRRMERRRRILLLPLLWLDYPCCLVLGFRANRHCGQWPAATTKPPDTFCRSVRRRDDTIDEDKPKSSLLSSPSWNNKEIKTSLVNYGTAAQPWLLNLIQAAHLALVPLSFGLAWTLWQCQTVLSSTTAFLGLLSLLVQTFGTTVAGLVYHEYEDWQFAETRQADGYNNARLRQVFLQILIGLLTLSSALWTLGVYGDTHVVACTVLGVTSVLVKLWAPATPVTMEVLTPLLERLKLDKTWKLITNDREVLPGLSIWDFGLFLVHSIVACAAYVTLLGAAVQGQLGLPAWLAVVPFLTIAAGGLYEGLVAETSFNQWDHLVGVIFFTLGMVLQIYEFRILLI